MASLTSSAVTPFPTDIASSEWPTTGKGNRSIYTRRVKLVLTGQGGTANTIPASAFGLTKLLDASSLFDASNNKVYPTMVDPVNNYVLVQAGATFAPGDVTAAVAYITVTGVI